MRALSIFFLIIITQFSNCLAQDFTLKVRKPVRESDYFPHIAGVMDGEIDAVKICSGSITNNKKWKVVSFAFSVGANQGQNFTEIVGDRFPNLYCERWKRIEFKGMVVFITNIYAIDLNKKKQKLNNLRLIVK
jgi:hypothetical protein